MAVGMVIEVCTVCNWAGVMNSYYEAAYVQKYYSYYYYY